VASSWVHIPKALRHWEKLWDPWQRAPISPSEVWKNWRHILEGTQNTIEIQNDHSNLNTSRHPPKSECWQACWSLVSGFIQLIPPSIGPGWHSAKLDALSQWADHPATKNYWCKKMQSSPKTPLESTNETLITNLTQIWCPQKAPKTTVTKI